MFARICLVVLWHSAFATSVLGQVTSATLTGTVADQTEAVLPGVDVTITNEATGSARSTVTDTLGTFTIPGLAPGSYAVRAALLGFRPNIHTGVVLTVGQQATTAITLEVGPAADAIEVVGGAAFVDLRASALSGIVSEAEIEALPLNGRNYISLALLAARRVGLSRSAVHQQQRRHRASHQRRDGPLEQLSARRRQHAKFLRRAAS